MSDKKTKDRPGIAFEKLVAAMQARIDPTSQVVHNENVVDRLGHSRQFDVVIRGSFAAQKMFGVIECKDSQRKVGNPEVDAFVTKARDVNANFKILMSRSGFTQPALEKCADYGIQALSLLENDPANKKFFLGTRWTADVTRWRQFSLALHFADPADENVEFSIEQLEINNKRVVDGFANYLLDHEQSCKGLGWVFDVSAVFDVPQAVKVSQGIERVCSAITFKAERVCERLEYRVGITGEGFFNWNSSEATFPSGATIATEPVPMDFSLWMPRSDDTWKKSGFVEVHIEAHSQNFRRVDDAIDLNLL